MRVPVLAYHAVNIAGNDYATNDHVAFAADLRLIDALGLRVVPLQRVADALAGRSRDTLDRTVALTCDDGSNFDYFDLDHPAHGPQRSLHNLMTDFCYERGFDAQPDLHLTTFVIASPDARAEIDRRCLVGRGWMGEAWWRPALQSGRIAIENHGLDHNHSVLPGPGIDGMPRGTFEAVDNHARADAEIRAAARYIDSRIAPFRTRLFCYPYSQSNDYLRREYFPRHGDEHGMDAAFGGDPQPVTESSDRWNLPRYVCGHHWKSPGELEAILRDTALRG